MRSKRDALSMKSETQDQKHKRTKIVPEEPKPYTEYRLQSHNYDYLRSPTPNIPVVLGHSTFASMIAFRPSPDHFDIVEVAIILR